MFRIRVAQNLRISMQPRKIPQTEDWRALNPCCGFGARRVDGVTVCCLKQPLWPELCSSAFRVLALARYVRYVFGAFTRLAAICLAFGGLTTARRVTAFLVIHTTSMDPIPHPHRLQIQIGLERGSTN